MMTVMSVVEHVARGDVQATGYQMTVLLQYNDADRVTFVELRNNTQMDVVGRLPESTDRYSVSSEDDLSLFVIHQ